MICCMCVSHAFNHYTTHPSLSLQSDVTRRPPADSSPSTPLPGGRAFVNSIQSPSDKGKKNARKPKQKPVKVVDVPLGQATYADVTGVDDGTRPWVLFFCLSWFQTKEKKQEPPTVYDDELEDDEEEENVLDPVAVPPLGYTKPIRSKFSDVILRFSTKKVN
ncbi:hypothetical protein F4604DRAFT_1957798 [Suillus subluteus]|nr:hypothetical protein F4604DRAFT_1957798 [Suillus subluteus]